MTNHGKAALVGAGLRHQREIRRRLAAIRRRGGILVRERRREAVGRAAGPLEHVAGIVRPVLDLVFGRERANLRLGEFRPAGLGEVAEGDIAQAVAGGADLPVDLEARAAAAPRSNLPNGPWKLQFELRRDRGLAGGERRSRKAEKGGGDEENALDHDAVRPQRSPQPLDCGAAVAPAGIPDPPFCTPITDSRIEFGSGSGLSNKPSSGRTIRKWAK